MLLICRAAMLPQNNLAHAVTDTYLIGSLVLGSGRREGRQNFQHALLAHHRPAHPDKAEIKLAAGIKPFTAGNAEPALNRTEHRIDAHLSGFDDQFAGLLGADALTAECAVVAVEIIQTLYAHNTVATGRAVIRTVKVLKTFYALVSLLVAERQRGRPGLVVSTGRLAVLAVTLDTFLGTIAEYTVVAVGVGKALDTGAVINVAQGFSLVRAVVVVQAFYAAIVDLIADRERMTQRSLNRVLDTGTTGVALGNAHTRIAGLFAVAEQSVGAVVIRHALSANVVLRSSCSWPNWSPVKRNADLARFAGIAAEAALAVFAHRLTGAGIAVIGAVTGGCALDADIIHAYAISAVVIGYAFHAGIIVLNANRRTAGTGKRSHIATVGSFVARFNTIAVSSVVAAWCRTRNTGLGCITIFWAVTILPIIALRIVTGRTGCAYRGRGN